MHKTGLLPINGHLVKMTVGQLSLYVQDEWHANSKLKMTFGLRVDKPIYDNMSFTTPNIRKIHLHPNAGTYLGSLHSGSPTISEFRQSNFV